MSQLSLIDLRISTTHDSPPSSKSGSSRSSASSILSDSSTGSETDAPAAYHVNLLNLIPTLEVPPPLRGMSRLRAVAQRQFTPPLDVLGILAKVVMRPRPVIHLGPIGTSRNSQISFSCPANSNDSDVNPDHTASCVIVDLDLPDHPLVWASDSFCQMSGYALEDIRGRNPRFMQAPGGHVLSLSNTSERSQHNSNEGKQSGPTPTKASLSTSSSDDKPASPLSRPSVSVITGSSASGSFSSTETASATPKPEEAPASADVPSPPATYIPPPRSHVPSGSQRAHTDNETVRRIKSKLDANEEVQSVVLNYRKDGTPFWNWLSIVPVPEGERFRWHVGIMVDLIQQPRQIMRAMQAGYYIRTQP